MVLFAIIATKDVEFFIIIGSSVIFDLWSILADLLCASRVQGLQLLAAFRD